MDPRAVDALDRADGARQLSFERAQVIDVLKKACGTQRVSIVEDFVANGAAGGQALFGERHAQAENLAPGHIDHAAVAAQFVGNFHGLERADHFRRIVDADIGEQERLGFGTVAQTDIAKESEQDRGYEPECHETYRSQGLQKIREAAHQPTSCASAQDAGPFPGSTSTPDNR